jgi:hypothetical protein
MEDFFPPDFPRVSGARLPRRLGMDCIGAGVGYAGRWRPRGRLMILFFDLVRKRAEHEANVGKAAAARLR